MKKLIILLLSISLLLAITGCNQEIPIVTTMPTQTTPTTESAETTQQTESPVTPDLPFLAFSAPVLNRQHYAEDGTLLMSYSYQDFSLILEDPQIADAIVIDLLNLVDYENSTAKNVLSDAQAAYTAGSEWVPFRYSTLFSPARFDQRILSLCGTHALNIGSPRPSTATASITYDLLTGQPLSLREILVPDYSADTLSRLIADSLSSLAAQGMLFSDYAHAISGMFSTNRPVDCWYLSKNGLCFYFAPYEIAPYSSGTITAEVPYSALVDLLREEYFLAEEESFSGNSYVFPFSESSAADFNQFAEVVLDSDGKQYLFYTDSCLQDVHIELGYWLDDGSFITEATVLACPALCNGDGIVITASADTVQALRISYRGNGEIIEFDLYSAIAKD